MTRLTKEANERLDQYLKEIRSALRGCDSVNADEVERDIREHIETELPGDRGEVTLPELNQILERLGKPGQWVTPREVPWWRRFVNRLRTGPEDWRLAYLAFVLLTFGVIFALPLWPLILVSYFVARAALAASQSRGEKLEAQRWFIYPSLLIVDFLLVALVMLALPALALTLGVHETRVLRSENINIEQQIQLICVLTLMAFSIYWVVLGIILALCPSGVRAILQPFAEGFKRKHGLILVYLGVGLGLFFLTAMLLGFGKAIVS
jgi:HAAS domain-containing protein